MKLLILFALVTVAVAQKGVLRSSESEIKPGGDYEFSFDIDDGTRIIESGAQKQVTVENTGSTSRGQYTYVVDGQRFTVDWIANENGFQATGDHLPTPPPAPAHVVKLLNDLHLAGRH